MRLLRLQRVDRAEWMDTRPVSQADFADCLDDLATVNRLTLATAPTLGFLARATQGWPRGATLSVVDCGSGDGAMLRAIHRWATRRGLRPRLVGFDLNPQAMAVARARTPAAMEIGFEASDLFAWRPARPPDFLVSALFAHHLDDAALDRFLVWQEETAARGWFVNDLHRHPVAWAGIWAMAHVARWHRFVRHDGPLSVRRAQTPAEWRARLRRLGLRAQVRWHLPFRLGIGRWR